MKTLTLLLASLLICLNTFAQHLDFGVSVGNASYIGDLITSRNGGHLNQFNLSKSVFVAYNKNRFRLKLELMNTTIEGDDENGIYPGRGLHFKTPILETSLTAAVNLTTIRFNHNNSFAAPYLFAGLAVYKFNPQALHNGEWIALQPHGTEGQGMEGFPAHYKLTEFAIPFGVGIKIKINRKVGIGFEIGVRKLFNDYLDDVSSTAISYLELYHGNGPLAAALSAPSNSSVTNAKEALYKRGAAGNDMYFVYQFNFSYTIFGRDNNLNFYYR